MNKHQFVKALISYFMAEERQGKAKEEKVILEKVWRSLDLLDRYYIKNKNDETLHFAHTFGPFGFKVQDDK